MKISEILTQARDSLTDNWNKGSYFAAVNDRLCMCSHGAVQAIVNPSVKQALEMGQVAIQQDSPINATPKQSTAHLACSKVASPLPRAVFSARDALWERTGEPHEPVRERLRPAAPLQSTVNRARDALRDGLHLAPVVAAEAAVSPSALPMFKSLWENRPEWVKSELRGHGSLDAHYLLGMVGLTSSFNDDPNTTLQMVKGKFTEAIDLAHQLEV